MTRKEELNRLNKVRDELYKQVAHIDLKTHNDGDLTQEEANMILRIEALTEVINDLEIEGDL